MCSWTTDETGRVGRQDLVHQHDDRQQGPGHAGATRRHAGAGERARHARRSRSGRFLD